jgi:hypothetical protein
MANKEIAIDIVLKKKLLSGIGMFSLLTINEISYRRYPIITHYCIFAINNNYIFSLKLCLYTECYYAKSQYPECHYAECCAARNRAKKSTMLREKRSLLI